MDMLFNLIPINPITVAVLAGGSTYAALEYFKPSIMYNDDKITLKQEYVSPMVVGATVAVLLGLYWSRYQTQSAFSPASALLGGSDFTMPN